MNKATFVIPLGTGSTWEDNEIRYMLRSLEQYCHFDFEVILYVTKKIDWLSCQQIVVKRKYPKQLLEFFNYQKHYENYYDVINKLRAIIDNDDIPEEFFFMYDDILLLCDLYYHDLKIIYAGAEYKNNPKLYDEPKTKWMRTINASLRACKNNGRPLFLYETHLPRYFKKSQLREMFRKFVPEENKIPYAISTLY